MNASRIKAMSPGETMDKLVHRCVMKRKDAPVPLYSMVLDTAFSITKVLPGLMLHAYRKGRRWSASFDYGAGRYLGKVVALTPAEAICKAALIAVSEEAGVP